MSTNFSWVVTNVYTMPEPTPNYVTMVQYTVEATDSSSNTTVSLNRSSNFPVDANQTSFIAFSDLTEEIILSWIQSDTEETDRIKEALQSRIDSTLNPPVRPTRVDPPWVK